MGLTVNRQTVKTVTVNRKTVKVINVTFNCQKWKILTVNRHLNQAKLAVKGLEYLLSRAIMVLNRR